MRFLDIDTCKIQEIKVASDCRDALAKCAIISHRFGGDDELSFQKYEERMDSSNDRHHINDPGDASFGSNRQQFNDPGDTSFRSEGESEGFLKLARARLKALEARRHKPTKPQEDLKYIWMDTCCINKQEPGELEEAIPSMFRWYNSATVCYAYLPDVSALEDEFQEQEKDEKGGITKPRVGCFECSDWFTRGWTLQELLAPTTMYFFDRYWRFLGTKETLSAQIQRVTGIESHYLHGDVSQACIAVKMSWLARRQTLRMEDMAYCMFGLFEISTFIRYGEGEGAFVRLGQELIRQRHPDESLFAWRSPKITSCGLLAPWPTCYLGSENLTIQSWKYARRKGLGGFNVVDGGIEFQAPNKLPENGNAADWMAITAKLRRNYSLKLNCWEAGVGICNTVTIRLHKDRKGNWRRINCKKWSHTWRPRSSRSIFGPKTRPMEIFQHAQGEEDWKRILAAEEPRD